MFDRVLTLPTFEQPLWLLLLIPLLPAMVWLSRLSLSGFTRGRSLGLLGLRMLVAMALVFALAGIEWNRRSQSLSVAYLLDQSDSIPAEHRGDMLDFVQASVKQHRQAEHDDRVAVVVFGRDAAVEHPALPYPPDARQLDRVVDGSATNLAEAMRVASSLLPAEGARRMVIVSDGNETVGRAVAEAQGLAERGTSIDVVPVPVDNMPDVAVDNVAIPPAAVRDQPYEIRVTLSNRGASRESVSGRLRVSRRGGDREQTLVDQPITVSDKMAVYSFRDSSADSDFYIYEARFLPDSGQPDRYARNNVATGFIDVTGRGRVLFVEDFQHPGEFDHLVERLRERGLEIDLQSSTQTFSALADLLRYDVVVLANVAYTNDDATAGYTSLSESQISMLVRNTRDMGAGLVVLGGDRSFGAGGWEGTELEAALPVEFRIKNTKVIPSGALAIVLDKSGSMEGDKIRMAVAAAKGAIEKLGPRDQVTVIAFDSGAYDIVPLTRVGDGRNAMARVGRLGAGGGTDLYPGMQRAYMALRKADASVKHVIVLTDGQTPPQQNTQLAAIMRSENITVSAVAVGPDADRQLLAAIATGGGGKFYAVNSPRSIPRIFSHEAVKVAMPVVRQLDPPRSPLLVSDHEILRGVGVEFPPLSGYVQTTLRHSPLVEVLLRSPVPPSEANSTLLATWTYGLGKATVFTSDAGHNWANAWTGWDHYDRLYEQLIRWSMRPSSGDHRFAISTLRDGDQTRVVVDAIDDESYLNALDMQGQVVGPDLKPLPLTIRQTAPGRYVGEFPSTAEGTYFVSIATSMGGTLLRTGVNVSSSDEFESQATNLPLLESIAAVTPPRGGPGKLVRVEDSLPFATPEGNLAALELNPYRRDLPMPVASRAAWPLMVLAASVLFFSDILMRRVHVDWEQSLVWIATFVGRRPIEVQEVTLERLKSRKDQVREQYSMVSSRFEPAGEHFAASTPTIPDPTAPPSSPGSSVTFPQPADETSGHGYTSRLLAAKRRAIPRHPGEEDERG